MKNSTGGHSTRVLFTIGLLVFSVLIFLLVLAPREISFLKTVSVIARYNTTRFVPLIGLMLFGALMINNEPISLVATAILIFSSAALSLNGLWAGAYSENYVLAGLIPRSDAYGFYTGVITFLEKGYLDGLAARRPLFGILFGLFLRISSSNLQIALGVFTYLIALSLFALVIEARKLLHPVAVTLLFLISFLFIRRFTGITMSEQIGFLLGTAALTAFLAAIRTRHEKDKKGKMAFLLGVCLFALSQAARPGSLALLPLLALFGGCLWKGERRFNWKIAGLVVLIIAAVFLFNNLVFQTLAADDTIQTGNFGYGVYGLAAGGKGWDQIFSDHPEINTLPHGAREARIMQIILETLRANPMDYLRGMLKQFGILFSFQETNSFFSFMWSSNRPFSYALVGASFALCLSAVFYFFKKPFSSLKIFIVAILLGFLASLSVAPAYQTQYMRVYAASIPALALLPAIGLHQLAYVLEEKFLPAKWQSRKSRVSTNLPTWGALFIAALVLLSPVLTGITAAKTAYSPLGCPAGQDEAVVRYMPGASIFIHRNSPDIYTWVPHITQLDYKGSIHNICCADEIDYFKNIPTPNVIFGTVNLLDDNALYLVAPAETLPEEIAMLRICGKIENVRRERADSGFLYPESIEIFINQ